MISHNMEDVRAVADRIVVLRDRRHTRELTGAEVATDEIVRAIAAADPREAAAS